MKYGSLIIEKKEYVLLKRLLNIEVLSKNKEMIKPLIKLHDELQTAHIIEENEMPEDIIRFNSIVSLSIGKQWRKTLQIVSPGNKNFVENKISILTPMGSALFGYSESDQVEWEFPNGLKRIKIQEVRQDDSKEKLNILI